MIQQVEHQQLQRQHRQERQERAGDQYAEHVAEVRAGGHLDVLDDVAKGHAPFDHALLQHHQVFFQQDDVGRLLGDVGGGIHRNADVGLAQRRRVVDAVAEKADRVAHALQRLHHARLLQRRHFGEHRGALDQRIQFIVLQRLDVLALRRVLHVQPDLAADLARHRLVVPGDHFHLDAVMAQRGDRGARGVLRRVEEGQAAHRDHVGFVGHAVAALGSRRIALDRHHQHAQAVLVELVRHRLDLGAARVGHWQNLVARF